MSRLEFVLSDEVATTAAATYRENERRIRTALPNAEVRHRGGTSLGGVLTTGDVDVHVRVEADSFESAREALASLYEPLHEDAWTPLESAFFRAPDSHPPVEVALTVVGSRDDVHHGEAWDRIATDPGLIARYNDLKRLHSGAVASEYAVAKRTFFAENF